MQPPGELPIYAQQIVGFAMWHLMRGEPAEDVITRIQADERFAGIDAGVIQASVSQAATNVNASQRALVANHTETIAEQFLRFVPTGEVVGVRVMMTLQFPDGHTEVVSVVVNANENATLARVLDAATAYVNAGGLNRAGRRHYQGTVIASTVGQLIDGGASNPLITV